MIIANFTHSVTHLLPRRNVEQQHIWKHCRGIASCDTTQVSPTLDVLSERHATGTAVTDFIAYTGSLFARSLLGQQAKSTILPLHLSSGMKQLRHVEWTKYSLSYILQTTRGSTIESLETWWQYIVDVNRMNITWYQPAISGNAFATDAMMLILLDMYVKGKLHEKQ